MTTKFNVGDKVFVEGKITGIHVFLNGKIHYDVEINPDLFVPEDVIGGDDNGYFEESHLLSAEEYGDRTVPASD